MPFLDPDDRVRRQRLTVVGFGSGEGAVRLLSSLVDTLQRWLIFAGFAVALFLLLWRVAPLAALAVLGGWIGARQLRPWLRSTRERRLAWAGMSVGGALLFTLFLDVPLLGHLPVPVCVLTALGLGWHLSGPVARHVSFDRPFRYWAAVLHAEATAPRPPRGAVRR